MDQIPNTRRVQAYAKINPFLRVLGRGEDGFHDLETVVLPISLADDLEIHAANDPGQFRTLSLSLEITGETGIVRGVPVDESNLVIEAAKALADRGGVRGFADVHLHKRIPAAAGLGGGSADAAATLSALNDLWGLGLQLGDLVQVAAHVGSDVPGMLGSPALVRGRGEDVARVECSAFRWALVTFDFGVSTADAYAWWDEDGAPTGPDVQPGLDHLKGDPDGLGPVLFNDLEGPVIGRNPRVGEAKRILLNAGAAGAIMAGSGSSVVGLLADARPLPPHAERDLERISGGAVAYVTSASAGPP
jgi:4-diphosphocytidyl-2-C-methyl-D-erythritol kinase